MLLHPPYSPERSPPVSRPKESPIQAALNVVIKDINKGCIATSVRMLPKTWDIDHKGGYIDVM